MVTTQRSWYLLTSRPRQDALAEEQLLKQEYEVYRPLAQCLRARRGKMLSVVESLFPRYMFIHLDDGVEDNWGPIRSTRGVVGFVRFGIRNLPPPIPEKFILALKAAESQLAERAIDLDRFHNGDVVVIDNDGPFKGLPAIFQHYDGEQRSVVMLEILHKMTRLAISPADLRAAA
ncbi:transcription termination/antitermination NusG family protein [Thiothrix unzii]|uniref:Transcription/translation regulatory transformer protein RfaH n=1 Tax=Thiothrix unzii TaxID=111769 RepID=A0A975IGM9_9GAMM|nr:transcription termination/antitermination NusG family protein [Thiothrix unzii]QTR52849.1 transcription/translation regulatory transformer protein RfaH [Thiothrix unzii]